MIVIKEKKKKVKYIDDGRTIADMSAFGKGPAYNSNGLGRPRSTAKEKWQTYVQAVKQMFIPMLIMLGIITVTFGIVYLLL